MMAAKSNKSLQGIDKDDDVVQVVLCCKTTVIQLLRVVLSTHSPTNRLTNVGHEIRSFVSESPIAGRPQGLSFVVCSIVSCAISRSRRVKCISLRILGGLNLRPVKL